MTCNIYDIPLNLEPPPPSYARAVGTTTFSDPETASITSEAPSYTSSRAPVYTPAGYHNSEERRGRAAGTGAGTDANTFRVRNASPNPLSSNTGNSVNGGGRTTGLPPARYAQGFTARACGPLADPESHSFNIANWTSMNPNSSRQYRNVAKRRVNKAATLSSCSGMLNSITSLASPTSPSGNGVSMVDSPFISPSIAAAYPDRNATGSPIASSPPSSSQENSTPLSEAQNAPLNPREDPYLVGEEAAARARSQRLYREMCLRGEVAVKAEGKAWDFMLGQMSDWDERSRSWKKFRAEHSERRTKLLGRGGLGGLSIGVGLRF